MPWIYIISTIAQGKDGSVGFKRPQYSPMIGRFVPPSGINRPRPLHLERLPSRPIINKELSNRTVVQGSKTTLQCSVISDQVPYITWLKHTTRDNGIDSQGKVINRLLIIKVKIRAEGTLQVHCVGLVVVVVGAGGG